MERIYELDEIKRIELDVLKEVDALCRELKLRYYLGYGTLLGAVRHKGFIPWDDDIDIMMPRPDYDRLIRYCTDNETTFGLMAHENHRGCNRLFAKAYAKNTLVKEYDNDNKKISNEYGVWIDIFPIDGLGDSYDSAVKLLKQEKILINLYAVSLLKSFKRNPNRPWYHEPIRLACYLITRLTTPGMLIQRIEKKCRLNDYDKSAYCGVVCENINNNEIITSDVFRESIDITFEQYTFEAPIDYHSYLTAVYGDYMTPPPVEERIPIHGFDAYYK